MTVAFEVDVLDDDVFCALDLAVQRAEAQVEARLNLTDMEDLGLTPVNLVQLRLEFLRLRSQTQSSAHELPQHSRQGITLSVTDVTSAQW